MLGKVLAKISRGGGVPAPLLRGILQLWPILEILRLGVAW